MASAVVGSYDDSSDPFSGRPVSAPAGWWDPGAELTPSVIDAYVRLRVSGGGRGQGLSAGTLARVHAVLRSALAQSQRLRAHRIKVRKTEGQAPTPDEVATLIEWLLSTTRCCTSSSSLLYRPVHGGRNFSRCAGTTSTSLEVVLPSSADGLKDRTSPC